MAWQPAGSRSVTARADDVWSTVTADARRLVIDPGDDSEVVRCTAPGVVYADDVDPDDACAFTYERSGTYTVSVTATWGADWAGSDGNGGTLPEVSRTTSFRVKVVQSRAELIDSPN